MLHRDLLRGILLIAIALAFGFSSLNYPLGALGRVGPGMFPLLVSILLLLTGVAIVVRSRLSERVPVRFSIRNISLLLLGMIGFVLLSQFVNMTVGIVFVVVCASLCATTFSLMRTAAISIVLVGIAFGFDKLLGLPLPLY